MTVLSATALSRSQRRDTGDFLRLFLHDVPLLDVRAPVEFRQGAFPASHNLPLLDDEQRERIGIRYRDAGQEGAIRLGEEMATPEIRGERLADWSAFCRAHPEGYLYCFRGGLRSHVAQEWLREAGIRYPLVEGGYKAMRGFLLAAFEENSRDLPLWLLAGRTGAGKTRVLRRLPHHVDLEGLARHRGSAFGASLEPQPPQIGWENAVSCALLKHRHLARPGTPLVLEDESRLIGRIWLPPFLQEAMARADLVVLERDRDSRVALILEEYVIAPWAAYQARFGAHAPEKFSASVLSSLQRIRKRLGGERHARVEGLFRAGLQGWARGGDTAPFIAGIRLLLEEYYDPMYDYLLARRGGRVLFRGMEEEVVEWAGEGGLRS